MERATQAATDRTRIVREAAVTRAMVVIGHEHEPARAPVIRVHQPRTVRPRRTLPEMTQHAYVAMAGHTVTLAAHIARF